MRAASGRPKLAAHLLSHHERSVADGFFFRTHIAPGAHFAAHRRFRTRAVRSPYDPLCETGEASSRRIRVNTDESLPLPTRPPHLTPHHSGSHRRTVP